MSRNQTREAVFHLMSKHREVICQSLEGVFHLIRNTYREVIYQTQKIGHFRVPPGLCFKTRVGAQP